MNGDVLKLGKDPIVEIRTTPFYNLSLTAKGRIFLTLALTPEQIRLYGQKISPFLCWKNKNLCRLNLSRVHLTCFTCLVRKMVSAELPLTVEIQIHQVWTLANLSSFRKSVFKGSLSFAEASGH